MNYAFYSLAALTIFAGLGAGLFAVLSWLARRADRRRARWVSGQALMLIAGALQVNGRTLGQDEDIFDLAEHLSRQVGTAGRAVLSDRIVTAYRRPPDELRDWFFNTRINLYPGRGESSPDQSKGVPRSTRYGSKEMSVAEIPLDTYALDGRVRANVLGGLVLIAAVENDLQSGRWPKRPPDAI